MTREEATAIAVAAAKSNRQSYYSEPFEPHKWVIEAVLEASRVSEEKLMVSADGCITAMERISASPDADLAVGVIDKHTLGFRMLAKDGSWCVEQTMNADEADAVIAAIQQQRSKIS